MMFPRVTSIYYCVVHIPEVEGEFESDEDSR